MYNTCILYMYSTRMYTHVLRCVHKVHLCTHVCTCVHMCAISEKHVIMMCTHILCTITHLFKYVHIMYTLHKKICKLLHDVSLKHNVYVTRSLWLCFKIVFERIWMCQQVFRCKFFWLIDHDITTKREREREKGRQRQKEKERQREKEREKERRQRASERIKKKRETEREWERETKNV